jgi:hypothetical protein
VGERGGERGQAAAHVVRVVAGLERRRAVQHVRVSSSQQPSQGPATSKANSPSV